MPRVAVSLWNVLGLSLLPAGSPSRTSFAIRSGCASANAIAKKPPIELPRIDARAMPRASRVPAMNAAPCMRRSTPW
jgi:hypothetical protein